MNKLEKFLAESARKYADASVNRWPCHAIFYQPKVSEQLKKRLEETRRK